MIRTARHDGKISVARSVDKIARPEFENAGLRCGAYGRNHFVFLFYPAKIRVEKRLDAFLYDEAVQYELYIFLVKIFFFAAKTAAGFQKIVKLLKKSAA